MTNCPETVNEKYIVYVPAGTIVLAFVAKNLATGKWYIMPSSCYGWSMRHEWRAPHQVIAETEKDINIAFYGPKSLAMAAIGIPPECLADGLQERKLAALNATGAQRRRAA